MNDKDKAEFIRRMLEHGATRTPINVSGLGLTEANVNGMLLAADLLSEMIEPGDGDYDYVVRLREWIEQIDLKEDEENELWR